LTESGLAEWALDPSVVEAGLKKGAAWVGGDGRRYVEGMNHE